MDIIISNNSALEYWRLYGSKQNSAALKLRRKSPPLSLPNIGEIRNKVPLGLSYPVNLMVGSQNAKWKSKVFRPRVYTGPTPDGCFISIGDGLAVTTPPFCFFQMADELPLAKLIELGYELCSTYSLSVKDTYNPGVETTDKNLYNHPLLTNMKALKTFTTRMKGVSGQKKASRAIQYIANGSGSPMETILVMLLTLPFKLGGYGLPMPEINKRIDIGNMAKQKLRRPGKAYYICDLFWPEINLALEYDSDFYHTGADRIAGDSKKRLDLAMIGIDVITVTGRQIQDVATFESLARLIARKTGKRLQYNELRFTQARRELRKLLL